MVYYLSKAFWLVVQPGNLLALLVVLGALLLFTRWRRLGRGIVLLAGLLLAIIAILPVGEWLLAPLGESLSPAHPDARTMSTGSSCWAGRKARC